MTNTAEKRPTPARLPVIRLEHLWVVLALSIIGGFIALVPTAPNDFWWHLKAGELIASEGIPSTNRFAWTLPADTPFVYQSWLGEWLFFALYRLGGLPLIVFARNMLGLLAFALVALEAKRRSGSWRLAAGVVLLAAAMTINNLTTRTQIWSWVPFVLVITLLSRYVDGNLSPRWLVALPLMMLLWVNLHGAFMLGLLVGGAFVVGEMVRCLSHRPDALTWSRLKLLTLAVGAMFIAALANPLGIGVFRYVLDLLSDVPSQSLINEWQSPTTRTLAGLFFHLGILALIAAFALARCRPTITDVLLVCGVAWQAFVGIRYVIWFGMAAMPIVAQSLAPVHPVLSTPPAGGQPILRREQGWRMGINMAIFGSLVLLVVVVQPWFKPLLPFPQPYRAIFADVPGAPMLFSADTPVQATNHLLAQPCEGRLFNEMGYGSYLDWAFYPDAQVFIDPRVELYPMSLWQDYVDLTKGRRVEPLLNDYMIACVLLDRQHQPRLAEAMSGLGDGWQQTFANERSEVWRRTR